LLADPPLRSRSAVCRQATRRTSWRIGRRRRCGRRSPTWAPA